MLCRIADSFYGTQRTVSRGNAMTKSTWFCESRISLALSLVLEAAHALGCLHQTPSSFTHPRLPHSQPIFHTLPARFIFLNYLSLLSAASNDMPSVVEFTEIVTNVQKDHPRLSRMWKVRDTLNRSKITKKSHQLQVRRV
jgi:hypothetical protein